MRLKTDKSRRHVRSAAMTGAMMGAVIASFANTASFAATGSAPDGQVTLAQAGAEYDFSIQPQSLTTALDLFAAKTGISFAYGTEELASIASAGLSGNHTVEQGLKLLLGGTGISYRFTGATTVSLRAAVRSNADGAVLEPIRVVDTPGRGVGLGRHPYAADGANSIEIGPEDIARRNPVNLRDLYAGDSAISVGGGVPAAQKVYVNGIEETQLAVTIDGNRQNNKVFHHNGTNLIDPSLLKSVRIDPGVAPADAGPGALGGSIAYETADVADLLEPGRDYGGFATGSYETNGDTFINSLSAYGQSHGFEALGYFKWGIGDDYEDGAGNTLDGSETDLMSFLVKGGYESSTGHRLELSAQEYRDDAPRPYRANIGSLTNRPTQTTRDYELKSKNYVLNYSLTNPTDLIDPVITLGFSEAEINVPEPFGSEGRTGGWTGKIENDFRFAEVNVLTAGADFYHNWAKYEDPSTPELEEKATNYGLYAQFRTRPIDMLSISAGVRGDYQEFEGVGGQEFNNSGLSGNISAEVFATDYLSFNAGYSNAWGGIDLQETYIFNPSWDYDGIEPVRSNSYTAGLKLSHAGFFADAGIFKTEIEDAREATFRGGPYIPFDFSSQGFTLGAGYNWGAGFVRVSYIDADVEIDGVAGDSDTLQYFGTPLGRVINLEAAHTVEQFELRVGGNVELALKNEDTVSQGYQALEAYEVVNLFAEHSPEFAEFLTLRIEANNLFDEDYADRTTYGQEFSNVAPMNEPGRSFMLYAKAKF